MLMVQLPISIVYLQVYLPVPNAEQIQLVDAFVADLESIYDAKAQKISTAEQCAPAEIRERGIKDYLKDVKTSLICSFFSKKKT